ncbi:hypothetical protein Tco_0137707 [Tanacetum coccineum]
MGAALGCLVMAGGSRHEGEVEGFRVGVGHHPFCCGVPFRPAFMLVYVILGVTFFYSDGEGCRKGYYWYPVDMVRLELVGVVVGWWWSEWWGLDGGGSFVLFSLGGVAGGGAGGVESRLKDWKKGKKRRRNGGGGELACIVSANECVVWSGEWYDRVAVRWISYWEGGGGWAV